MLKAVKVMVVAGESGSGKTHAALSCNPQGVTILLQFGEDVPHVKESAKGFYEIVDEERVAFADVVVNKCVSLLPAHKNLSYLQHVPLHIVIDEMGRQPNRLRVAISESSRIFKALERKKLGWNQRTMKMFCLGTGVSHSPTVISSMPDAFQLCTLGASSFNKKSADDNVLVRLFAEIRSQERKQSHQFEVMEKQAVKHFSEHRLIKPLLDNYRAAAILASHVHRVLDSLQDNTQHATLMSSAEYALFYVSQRFKSLNGLSSLEPEQAMSACAQALRQSLCGPTLRDVFAKWLVQEANVTALERDGDDDKLVSSYGIMTEHVEEMVKVEKFILRNNIKTMERLKMIAEKNPKLGQLLRLPRFAISRSVASMMSGNFGLGGPPVSSQSGEGLEHAITMKFVLIMRCFRNIKESVRHHVLTSSTACVPPKASVDAIKPLSPSSTPTLLDALEGSERNLTVAPPVWTGLHGVHLCYLEQRLSRGNYETKKTTVDGKDVTKKVLPANFVKCNKPALRTLGYVYDAVHEGKAVVMLNAKGAPYADVVVVAAGFVCLVQCKQAATFDVPSEVYKMMDMQHNVEITSCLCEIAGVARSDVVVLFVTAGKEASIQKQNQSEDKQTLEKGQKQTEPKTQHYADGHYPCEVRVSKRSSNPHEDVLFPFVWPSTPVSTTELYELCSVGL